MPDHCIICGSRPSRAFLNTPELQVYKCELCGIGFQRDFAVTDYSANYYDAWWSDEKGERDHVRMLKENSASWILRELQAYLGPGKSILEIGCAFGFFLRVARQRGYRASGLEISNAAEEARAEGFEVYDGPIEKLSGRGVIFDAVVMSDVLEHLEDPQAALDVIKSLLAPNGILVITTPDLRSFSAKLLGSKWPHFKKEHLYYFSRRGLRRLLEKQGWRVEMIKTAWKSISVAYLTALSFRYRNLPAWINRWMRAVPFSRRPCMIPSGLLCVARVA